MKRLLLRTPKSPFTVVSPETAYHRNLIGDNAGNLVFLQATYKILGTSDQRLDPGNFSVDPVLAPVVNERYDAYVMPLANAFRPSYELKLKRIVRFIERLRIPVVILGVGAQSTPRFTFEELAPMEPLIRRFVGAVLDRGPSIGVRGEITAEYLFGLGFRDVEVIGCPSMFLHADRMPVEKRLPALGREAPISINVSPYVKSMGPITLSHAERYRHLTYIAQDHPTLGAMLGAGWPRDRRPGDPIPLHSAHPFFANRLARFYVEPWPWIEDLERMEFSFGTRIHGNIAALLAGTPAYVFAHDSRTLELARYFEIPHRPMADVPPDVDAADLYAEADYTGLVQGHARRWRTFTDYLARHELRHVWQEGEDPAAFDERIRATAYPPAVSVTDAMLRPASAAGRVLRLRHRTMRSMWAGTEWAVTATRRLRRQAKLKRRVRGVVRRLR